MRMIKYSINRVNDGSSDDMSDDDFERDFKPSKKKDNKKAKKDGDELNNDSPATIDRKRRNRFNYSLFLMLVNHLFSSKHITN